MVSKKIVGLVLAGVLLIGATGAGTYAYFTSEAKASANLKITTGTLNLKAEGDNGWTLNLAEGKKVEVDGTGKLENNELATNLKPGDYLTKTIKIENDSSLDQQITKIKKINTKELNEALKKNGCNIDSDRLIVEITPDENAKNLENTNNIIHSDTKELGQYTVKVTINPEWKEVNKTDSDTFDLNALNDLNLIKIEGQQLK